MGATWAAVREKTIWIVDADRSDKSECASWRFDDKEVAEWFQEIVSEYYLARCPTCGMKDMLGVEVGAEEFAVAFVSCGFFDCDFAKRVVRRDGLPMTVDQL